MASQPNAEDAANAAAGGPWRLAWRRLRRNRVALVFGGLFILIAVFTLGAPIWADNVAHTGPNATHTLQKLEVDGEKREVVNPSGRPIGPQWFEAGGKFFLGADGRLGRDEMVRLMYGGRTSLLVGFTAALLTTLVATLLGLLAGYYRGWTDTLIARAMDVIWAFPVILLAIALGLTLAVGGLQIGPLELSGSSIWIPILIIGGVYVPYMARPIRGEVLSLREKEFVEAAEAQGAGALRVMFGELLPNLASTIIVFFTLGVANAMLLEAMLSFLGVGVQAPNTSWGTMIGGGFQLISSAPLLTVLPGTMLLLTVLSVNVFGDGLRDALDPRSKLRLELHAGTGEPEGTAV
ncbi:MAG TPA: ABC transporter permease [Solirubrobacterales bacterium]|nr:ABC transporter permease [Solirubrobacterales bacterium]